MPASDYAGICLLFPPPRKVDEVAMKCLVEKKKKRGSYYPSPQTPLTANWNKAPWTALNRKSKQPGQALTWAAADLHTWF